MARKQITIPISRLIIDRESTRVFQTNNGDIPEGVLPRHRQREIIDLAGHISAYGLNPSDLPIVMPSLNSTNDYIVLDGNRRLIVLRGLEKPDYLAKTLDADMLTRLWEYSKTYLQNPVESLHCVCVENRDDAAPWIEVRHSECNHGAGIVPRIGLGSHVNLVRNSPAGIQSVETSWSPDQIALVIMTVKRPNNYLSKTLESLTLADSKWRLFREVGLAVDSPDASWIPVFLPARKLTIAPLNIEETIRVETYKLHRRACHNYYRALQLATSCRGLIVCEDDIVFREGWIEKLCQSLDEMQENGVSNFVLSLYSANNHDNRSFRRGTFYSSYLASSFYGTQCVFYTASEIPEVSSLIWKNGVQDYLDPYDLILKQYCERKQNLYVTRYSLVQHIGLKSTGLGGNHHRSPTFHLSWPSFHLATESLAHVVAKGLEGDICRESP